MANGLSVERIADLLTPVFDRYSIRRAVLFGSFAKNTATDDSDVDLLVDSGLTGLRFFGFTEAVRRAVDRPVDVFDVSHIEENSRIDREIRSTGVTIYAK